MRVSECAEGKKFFKDKTNQKMACSRKGSLYAGLCAPWDFCITHWKWISNTTDYPERKSTIPTLLISVVDQLALTYVHRIFHPTKENAFS